MGISAEYSHELQCPRAYSASERREQEHRGGSDGHVSSNIQTDGPCRKLSFLATPPPPLFRASPEDHFLRKIGHLLGAGGLF